MSTARHRWEPEASRSKWRVLDRCAKCGLRRWLIQFENRSSHRRQTFLYSRMYDPWTIGPLDCAADRTAKATER